MLHPCRNSILTELRRPLPIHRHRRPIIRPDHIPIRPQSHHWLNRKTHSLLRCTDGLISSIVRHTRQTMKYRVDTVSTERSNHTAVSLPRMRFNHIPISPEQRPRLDQLDRHVQALPGCFDDPDGIEIRFSLVPDVVRLVEIAVVPAVVKRDVDVEDVTVHQDALVGDTVADDFVEGGADGFGEEVVV